MHSESLNGFEKRYQGYKPLVLIVDNDRDNLLFASCVIESLGIHHAVTDDSEKCLDLVGELLPDLILLDIVMPKIDGLEITRMIRRNKNICHIPIIAVTGLTRPQDTNQLIEAGCDDYLCKPYLIEELESKVSRLHLCALV
ncbi:MAG: response regulator [Xenococcaceae cyanobacterium MO_234.B1]|nr:response regulator [Xenococcaceae cyanobacterium MO_234.B1]